MLYCADCGSRLAYINSQSKDGKTYDSNQVFRCSRYHNKYHSCTGHYIKAKAEAGDPIAKERYEKTLAKRREAYHTKKSEQTA
ncbi:MAG: zinc ribbon domain-containing protein [Lachnospiraceae bacterium]|nr:zinc ribbon domain-containing protein [Lachnospiraceae bacterium]